MALINCSECGSEVSEKAASCPRCGNPIFKESKVVVYGYTQMSALNPQVEVFWNGSPVGKVKKGDRIEFDIMEEGIVGFKAQMRSAELNVKSGQVTNIKISWDRISGKLVPQIVDSVTPKN